MRRTTCKIAACVLWLTSATTAHAQPTENKSTPARATAADTTMQLAAMCRESPGKIACLQLYRQCIAPNAYAKSKEVCATAGFSDQKPDAVWLTRVAAALLARCKDTPGLCAAYELICWRMSRTPRGAMLCQKLGFRGGLRHLPFKNVRFRPTAWLQMRQSPFEQIDYGVGVGASARLWLDKSAIEIFGLVERHQLGGDIDGFAVGMRILARPSGRRGGAGKTVIGVAGFYSQHGSENQTRHRAAASWVTVQYDVLPMVRLETAITLNYLQPLDWLGVLGDGVVRYYSPVSAGVTFHYGPVHVGGAITQYLGGAAHANLSGYAAVIF